MWKWILFIVLVLAGSCVGTGYWLQSSGKLKELQEKYQPGAQAAKVRLATVARGDLVRTVSAPGQVEPKTKVEISAQVSARIIALPFREGQAVRRDDVIVRLDGREVGDGRAGGATRALFAAMREEIAASIAASSAASPAAPVLRA